MFNTKIDYASRLNRQPYYRDTTPYDRLRQKEVEIEQFTTIGDDEILLGYDPDDPYKPVTIPFNKNKRITIVIQGDNSSGKSILARNLAIDQLHYRFGRKVLFIDPKGDSKNLMYQNKNQEHKRILENHGIMPGCYEYTKYISPAALSVSGAWGEKYPLGLNNYGKIRELDMRLQMIWNAFFTKRGEAPARALQDFFSMPDNIPLRMQDFYDKVCAVKPAQLVLQSYVKQYMENGTMADEGIDYARLLKEYGILAVQLVVSNPKKDTPQDIFFEDVLSHCVNDRKLSVVSGNREGSLSEPFCVLTDEGDNFMGKEKSTANLAESLTTKYREFEPAMKAQGIKTYGCDSIILSQHSYTLEKIPISEADWMIFSRVSDENDFQHRMKDRGYDGVNYYEWSNMEYEKDVYPKLFCAIDKNKTEKYFYPLPSRTLT